MRNLLSIFGFKKTSQKVASKEQEKALDDALNLKSINLRLDSSIYRELERKAQSENLIVKAYIRKVLVEHVEQKIVNG